MDERDTKGQFLIYVEEGEGYQGLFYEEVQEFVISLPYKLTSKELFVSAIVVR